MECVGLKKILIGAIGFITLAVLQVPAHADMRCGTSLISEGDSTFEVLRKCGEPAHREVIPAVAAVQSRNSQAATIENWGYGPWGGAYYELKFIDGKLVSIDFSR